MTDPPADPIETAEPLTALVADDEPLARKNLAVLIAAEPDLALLSETTGGRDTATMIREVDPDVVFLDIQMPFGSGLDVLRNLPAEARPATILVTAHADHAVEAYDLGVVDYLVKPFETARFRQAMDRARAWIEGRRAVDLVARFRTLLAGVGPSGGLAGPPPAGGALRRILVREPERSFFVETDRLLWVEGDGPFVRLHTEDGVIRHRARIYELEEALDPQRFVRIHRSTIVRVDQIHELVPYFHGDYVVKLRNGATVRLSRRRTGVLERLLR